MCVENSEFFLYFIECCENLTWSRCLGTAGAWEPHLEGGSLAPPSRGPEGRYCRAAWLHLLIL